MKRILLILMVILSVLPFNKVRAYEEDTIRVYIFHSETCARCHELFDYIETIRDDYPNVEFIDYEISDFYAIKLLNDTQQLFDVEVGGTPFTIIGNKTIQGFSKGNTDKTILRTLNHYSKNFYNDTFGVSIGISEEKIGEDTIDLVTESVSLPIFGEVDLKTTSLFTVTFLLGIVDGFNPCAMWVLLFLISILITMKDRRKMWILGLTFIATSAAIYFLFMSAWLNLMLIVGTPVYIRIGIGIFAVLMGLLNLKNYYENRNGEIACEVVDDKNRGKIIDRIRKFTSEKNMFLALIGIIVLAVSVNTIELFCSLGLPVIYTELLTVSNLNNVQYYGYILLYTLFFMLDDIIVFSIAMFTMKITGFTGKYTKLAKLIGGIVMVLIGLSLVFAPNLLF